MMVDAPRTLLDKIWDRHAVIEREDGRTLLYVDRHLIHDGSRRAFEVLGERNLLSRGPYADRRTSWRTTLRAMP